MRHRSRKQLRSNVMGVVLQMAAIGMHAIGLCLSLTAGVMLDARGQAATIGAVYLFVAYTDLIYRPVMQITRQMEDFQRATAGLQRIQEIWRAHSTILDGNGPNLPPGPLAVACAEVSFRYEPDEEMVLREIFARPAAGPDPRTPGTYRQREDHLDPPPGAPLRTGERRAHLGGVDLRSSRLSDVRRRVGLVTQDVQIFHASVRDNVTFFDKDVSDTRIEEVLDELGLRGWFSSLPKGLDTILNMDGTGLSAGEAQLLAMSRVFLRDPGLVILDEASSRLDPATESLLERRWTGSSTRTDGRHCPAHRRQDRRTGGSGYDPGRTATSLKVRWRGNAAADRPRSSAACWPRGWRRSWRESILETRGERYWYYLWRLLLYRPWLYLLNAVFVIMFSLIDLVPGLIVREVLNSLSGKVPAHAGLWWLIAILFGSTLARMGFLLSHRVSDSLFRFSGESLLRKNLIEGILRRPGAYALTGSPGEAVSRLTGDVREVLVNLIWINELIGLAVFAVVGIGIMAGIDARITFLVFLPLVLVVAAANLASAKVLTYRRASRRAAGVVIGFIAEVFGAVQAIKVTAAGEQVAGEFARLNEVRRKAILKDRLFNEVLVSVFQNAVNLGTGFILLLAGKAMRAGGFTVGDFSLFVYCLNRVTELTGMAGVFIARYKQTGVSLERMRDLIPGAPPAAMVEHGPVYMHGDPPSVPAATETVRDRLVRLTARGLTYHYPGTGRGIEGVDLTLDRGSFTVIAGRIGAGKTTLLRVLLGLLPKEAGEICWNGRAVEDPGDYFTPPTSAYTPQVPRLFSESLTG